jgi:quercetin dioxygenase-like cupin family protein
MRRVTLIASLLLAQGAMAQQTGIERRDLQKIEGPAPGFTTESFLVTVVPKAVVSRHTHSGVEMGYVISGAGTLSVAGQSVRTVKSGDSWAIPADVPHELSNTGQEPERIVATFVVRDGKPLASPAR